MNFRPGGACRLRCYSPIVHDPGVPDSFELVGSYQKVPLAAITAGLHLVLFGLSSSVHAASYRAPAGTQYALRVKDETVLPGGRVLKPTGRQVLTGPGPYGLAISASGKTVVTANIGLERFSITAIQKDKKGAFATRNMVATRHVDDDFLGLQSVAADGKEREEAEWRGVSIGIALSGERAAWISEGNSGAVRMIDLESGEKVRAISLNQGGFQDSYSGDLCMDSGRNLLYVLDQANFRVVVIDAKRRVILSSVKVGRLPFALALSPDAKTLYVTNVGIFEYRKVPGTDAKQPLDTALPFPAFGFPSPEAERGAKVDTRVETAAVPGLGSPNASVANSVAVVEVTDPEHPIVKGFIRTGQRIGKHVYGGSSPCGVLAVTGKVFVSNAHDDSVSVIDPSEQRVEKEIAIRIPGLETLRGIMPQGLAYDATTGWLLVAESGINAVGVIDVSAGRVIGHIPVGWFPTRVAIHDGTVWVSNVKGRDVGPDFHATVDIDYPEFTDVRRRGTVSIFNLPTASELRDLTGLAFILNGFRPVNQPEPPIPPQIKHVVLIVKENRTFDEVFGDIIQATNGALQAAPQLARFGTKGYASGQRKRFSLKGVNVTPNHHGLAEHFAFSDNFYADSEVSVDGHHWLVGAYPDPWTETSLIAAYTGQKSFSASTTAPGRFSFAESNSSVHPEEQPEAGTLWHQLERYKISFRNFGEGFELAGNFEGPGSEPTGARLFTNMPMPEPLFRHTSRNYPGFNTNIPDQYRADQFISEIQSFYGRNSRAKSGSDQTARGESTDSEKVPVDFPQFIYIHLPNDHIDRVRPEDGYPYAASYVADNDFALGRIIEYLSHTPEWKEMAVFVTEDDAQGGVDHVDSHRTILLGVGPYFKQGYVSHANSSFPGLLKTIFHILGVPPLNLYDASATSLSDMFRAEPDFTPYNALPEDGRLFDPTKAKQPDVPGRSVRMDSARAPH